MPPSIKVFKHLQKTYLKGLLILTFSTNPKDVMWCTLSARISWRYTLLYSRRHL